jgi:hypothetical protein
MFWLKAFTPKETAPRPAGAWPVSSILVGGNHSVADGGSGESSGLLHEEPFALPTCSVSRQTSLYGGRNRLQVAV